MKTRRRREIMYVKPPVRFDPYGAMVYGCLKQKTAPECHESQTERKSTKIQPHKKKVVKKTIKKPSKLLAELQTLQDKDGIITNTKQFECTICIRTIKIGDGVVLRDCIHQFCHDCTKNTIILSDDAEISCPSGGAKSRCDGIILDHEIRDILSAAEYETYLNRSLRIAEVTIPNTVHCKKVDCVVWCICDGDVKQFVCQKCQSPNCVPCQAIHKGINCATYQNENKKDGEMQRTLKYFHQEITNNMAMKCPKCQIVITKQSGCDYICCSMCRTDICWVTKQARWGPRGKGDISGGCRCGVDGKKCHPDCGFCH